LITTENAHWAMNFVLGAILRFQTIPAPFDLWGRCRLKVRATCTVIDGDGADVDQLAVGAIIEDAGYCDHFRIGDAWMWEEGGQRRFVRLADCEVQGIKRHAQLARERRRAHYADADAADGTD